MNIVVCVKQVPDTWSEKKLAAGDSTLDRAATDPVMNEMDEYAVEEALKIEEASGGEVTVLCMGPDAAAETVRKALSMGADKAIHVLDDGLHGSDAVATSLVLAKALGTTRVRPGDAGFGVLGRADERDPGDAGRAAGRAAADLREGGHRRRDRR